MIRGKLILPKNFPTLNRDYSGFHQRAGDYMVSSTKAKIDKGIRPANSPLTKKVKKGNKTLRDRGGLYSSFHSKSDSKEASASTNHPAAKINQEGGTITPKRAKRLTIPASDRTRTLMRRYGATPRLCIDRMKAEGWRIWFAKNVIMAQETERSRPFALFILKSKIKIPKRRFLFISRTDRKVIREMFRNDMWR